jgi:hypothetical protein
MSHEVWITKVADHEIICLGLAEPWELEIGASHPEAFAFEPFDKMVTDPPAPHTSAAFPVIGFEDISLAPAYAENQVHVFGTIPYSDCRVAWLEPRYRPSGEMPSPA